ncbi:MAG TPA: circularly permuted type 2 ATP-grasp protein, partial [Acidimicrobiales bacterium]|nr:circularly permuted type 2 ATP-grasp protein [Acidimicrobiales bacterium]
HWAGVAAALDSGPDLGRRCAEADRLLAEDGVTYHVTTGADAGPRPWITDPVPLVLPADEWADVERGVAQRALVLDRILEDLYGDRALIRRGVLPPEVVFAHPGFLHQCDGIRLPGAHQLFLAAADLARDADGHHVVLSDRTQAPSGAGYALENRVVVSRVLPGVHRHAQVQRLAPFFRALRSSLHHLAPPSDDTPRIVVLTPGQWSETAFEHGYLAAQLGVPLVQGEDLRVRDGRVWLRALDRLEPVHVIVRRVDATFCDPVELRPDSNLGVPGLLEACRTGTVSVVNSLGSGVLENPARLRDRERRLRGHPLRERPRALYVRAGGDPLVAEPDPLGFGRVHRVAGQDDPLGLAHPHPAEQQPTRAAVGHETHPYEAQVEARVVGGDDDVAGESPGAGHARDR